MTMPPLIVRHRLALLALTLALVVANVQPVDDGVAGVTFGPTRHVERSVLRDNMSTKTVYPEPVVADLLAATLSTAQCVPVQLNFVVRHGTRYPTIKDITRINRTHAKLQHLARSSASETTLVASNSTLEWAKNWTNPFPDAVEGTLAATGVDELIAIGARLRKRFASSLSRDYDSRMHVFEHTWKERTRQSAEAFAFGFFRGLQPVFLHADAKGSDHVLRFYDNCPAFDVGVDRNKSATIQHARYRDSAPMKASLAAFRDQVGRVTSGVSVEDLDQKDMEAAYAGCAFDVAVLGVEDRWCTLFDDESLLTMDYFHDLKHFYKKSHGNAVAFEIAAPLLQDMVTSMRLRAEGRSAVEGHFRFAHAETILPFASLLNLSYFDRHASDRDGHYLADTPLHLAKARKFRGSSLAPFAANIGFVLYDCQSPTGSQFMVQTLLNEREVTFPECGGGQTMCTLEQFEVLFRHWLVEYDFHLECAI